MTKIGSFRSTDPSTSREAAELVDATRRELQVWQLLKLNPQGLAVFQIARALGFPQDSWASPRLRPLCRKGLVKDSGLRKINPVSGRHTIVWVLTNEPL